MIILYLKMLMCEREAELADVKGLTNTVLRLALYIKLLEQYMLQL